MSSRNIAVRRDVYDALRKERHPDESFSRILERLLNRRGALAELVGSWGGRPSAAEERRARARRRPGGRT